MKAEKEGKFRSSHRREPTFITSGFTNRKEANKCFSKHQCSACHREAVVSLCLLPAQILGHVDDLMGSDIKQQKVTNRKMLIKILEDVRYLARQGLPFCGHDGSNGNTEMRLYTPPLLCAKFQGNRIRSSCFIAVFVSVRKEEEK